MFKTSEKLPGKYEVCDFDNTLITFKIANISSDIFLMKSKLMSLPPLLYDIKKNLFQYDTRT